MKYYIIKKNNEVSLVSLETVPEELGLDKIDFDNGLYIEVPEYNVRLVADIISDLNNEEIEESYITVDELYDYVFPKKYYYIKSGKMIELKGMLNPKFYNIGTTWDEYLGGSYLLLNEEQVHYYLYNPESSIYLIWNLGVMPEPKIPTLGEVKAMKLNALAVYDSSDNVNGFTINGFIPAWFSREERNTYTTSVNAAKLLGNDTLTFAVGDNILQVSTDKAEYMLAALQAYADECYVITKQHELAIASLETVEEVNDYDFTQGYPEKLNFDLV